MDTEKLPWLQMIEQYARRIKEIKRQEQVQAFYIEKLIEYDVVLQIGLVSEGFKIYLDPRCRDPVRGFYYYSNIFWSEEQPLEMKEVQLIAEYFNIY